MAHLFNVIDLQLLPNYGQELSHVLAELICAIYHMQLNTEKVVLFH